VAACIEAMLEDGDARAVPVALRTVVDSAEVEVLPFFRCGKIFRKYPTYATD